MQRMRQGLSAIGPTPAERRVDEGGPAPDLTRGLSGSLQAIAEILGPQADIAAMVDEAKRAERSFTKGDYVDALGSMGLAAIAPLMIATPGSVKSVREVSEELIPQKIFSKEPDAIGNMTGSTDKYSSVEMIMDKKKFDANVENLPKSQIKKDSVEYLTKALKNNKPVAQPFITLKWDGSTWKPQKGTHEGRHRTIAAEKVFGKGVKFPVNVQLRTKKGSTVPIEELTGRKKFYKVKDQDEADKMLAELEKFNISSAIEKTTEELIPQRLFHGTSNPDIKKFKYSKEGTLGEGVYLTPDPKYASTYATGDTANVIPVSAEIKNPLVVQTTGVEPSADVLKALGVPENKAFNITEKAFDDKGNITKEISTRARKQGYDAVVLKDKDGNVQEIVAYKPDNISSAIGKKAEEAAPENIPVMPVNQAKLEEKGFEFKPGGEYVNPKNNEILTGRNVGFANIKIVPEMGIKGDRPMASFNVNNLDVPEVGTVGKGNTDIKVNLIKPTSKGGNGRGWLWTDLKDKNFKDVNTLVSVHVPSKNKHYYTMETDFSKGANLKTYPKNRDEPRLRPTAKGTLDFEDQIGTIQMGKDREGKPVMHPVYRRIVAKYTGGQIKKGGSIIERNPYNYPPRSI